MFGFGEKKTTSTSSSEIPISVMPMEFYDGKNPTVTFKASAREVAIGGLSQTDKRTLDRATAAGSGQPMHPATLFTSRRFLFGSGGVLFVIFVAGISWYYIRQAEAVPTVANLPAPIVEVAPIATNVIPEEVPVVTPEVVATTTPPVPVSLTGSLDFPSIILGSAPDTDADGLTDPEEELFKTDPGKADTDGDKHTDSIEVFNLYSPLGKEPEKLIDSQLVNEFVNPVFNYKLYYPTSWAAGAVDQNYHDVLFSTLTGENIEVRVFEKTTDQTFADWFSVFAPGEQFGSLIPSTNIFKEVGYRRSDSLVFYFPRNTLLVAILYHPAPNTTVVNYRTVLTMLAQSFRLFGNDIAVPSPTPTVVFDTTSTPVESLNQ